MSFLEIQDIAAKSTYYAEEQMMTICLQESVPFQGTDEESLVALCACDYVWLLLFVIRNVSLLVHTEP